MEETLTDFCALLEDDDADLAAVLLFKLFQANGSAEACGARTDDADVDVVGGTVDIGGVEEFSMPERGRV